MFDEIKDFFNKCTLTLSENGSNIIIYNGELEDFSKIQDNINNIYLAKRLPVYNMVGENIGYIDSGEYDMICFKSE